MLYWPGLRPKQIIQAFDLFRGRRSAADAGRRKPQASTPAAASAPSRSAAAKPIKGR